MEVVLEEKLLDFNLLKSAFLIVGNKKARKKLQKEVDKDPITLCNQPMKQVLQEKYLGLQLAPTVAGSIAATIKKRLGLAFHSIHEIRTILEDSRVDAVGSLIVGLDVWNMAIMPMVLSGAEVFDNIPRSSMDDLTRLVQSFLKMLFGLSKNRVLIPSLYWDTKTLLPQNNILLRKLGSFTMSLIFLQIVWQEKSLTNRFRRNAQG